MSHPRGSGHVSNKLQRIPSHDVAPYSPTRKHYSRSSPISNTILGETFYLECSIESLTFIKTSSKSVSMHPEFSSRGPVDRPQYASSISPGGLPLAQPPLENRPRMTQEQLLYGQGPSLEAGPKIRLRKACDSCAIRKVKVSEISTLVTLQC